MTDRTRQRRAGQVGLESVILLGAVTIAIGFAFGSFGNAASKTIAGSANARTEFRKAPTIGSTYQASVASALSRLDKLRKSLVYANSGLFSSAHNMVDGARVGARRKAVSFDMGYPTEGKLPRSVSGTERNVFPTLIGATTNEHRATKAFDTFLDSVLEADRRDNLFPALLEAERRWIHAGNAVGPDDHFNVRLVEKAREDWVFRNDGLDIGPRVWKLPFFWSDHGSQLLSDISRIVWDKVDPSGLSRGPIDADHTSALFSLTPKGNRRGGWRAEIIELTDATHLGRPSAPGFQDFRDALTLAIKSSRIDNVLGEALERGMEAFAFGSNNPILVRLVGRDKVLGRGPLRKPGVVPASDRNTIQLTSSEVVVGSGVWYPPLQNRYVRPTRSVPF